MAKNLAINAIEQILESLFHVLPIIHKRLLGMYLDGVAGDLSRLHLAIMYLLRDGEQPASELARKLAIPRSQMTHLLDDLGAKGITLRRPDPHDRRVTSIELTTCGQALFEEYKRRLKDIIREKLAALTEQEVGEMAAALEKLKELGAKLKKERR